MQKNNTLCDVGDWLYSEVVRDHFFNPRNLLIDDSTYEADGIGVVGSPACGDMMAVWIEVEKETGRIRACKWRTFGCASAIASTSMMSVMATEDGGRTLSRARRSSSVSAGFRTESTTAPCWDTRRFAKPSWTTRKTMQSEFRNYVLRSKETEAPGVTTLSFSDESNAVPPFTSGQYINVYFPEAHTPEGKAYSISSAPDEQTFSITVRAIGEFSNRLSALRKGDTVSGSLPNGFFF